jgi:hypothetical protein
LSSPPGSTVDKVKAMSKTEKLNYFRDTAHARIKAGQVDGIYILVCTSPSYLFVEIQKDALSAFPDGFRKKVEDTLMKSFGEKKYDDGLREVTKLVSEARGLTEKK